VVAVSVTQDDLRRYKNSIIASYMSQCDEKYMKVFGKLQVRQGSTAGSNRVLYADGLSAGLHKIFQQS
jgi:hypothetical protein